MTSLIMRGTTRSGAPPQDLGDLYARAELHDDSG